MEGVKGFSWGVHMCTYAQSFTIKFNGTSTTPICIMRTLVNPGCDCRLPQKYGSRTFRTRIR